VGDVVSERGDNHMNGRLDLLRTLRSQRPAWTPFPLEIASESGAFTLSHVWQLLRTERKLLPWIGDLGLFHVIELSYEVLRSCITAPNQVAWSFVRLLREAG
jgi:hypothetical protein